MYTIETLKKIKDSTNIIDVISENVILKKRGKEFIGLCPFHSEKTPSFNVNQEKQMYYCFGCQAGGDIYKFYQTFFNVNFSEAVLELADKSDIKIEKETDYEFKIKLQALRQRNQELKKLETILAIASEYFQNNLKQINPKTDYIFKYLKSRKIEVQTIEEMGIGCTYSANCTDYSLYKYLKQRGYSDTALLEAGLIKKVDKGFIDFFRDRLIFPIHDYKGKIVGFSGRVLSDSNMPKYLNSPDSKLFNKSKLLFNLHRAKRNNQSKDKQVVFTEGYFDAIALHQQGIPAVAIMGSSITNDQIKITSINNINTIVLWLDNDRSGLEATNKFLNEYVSLTSNLLLNIKIVNQFQSSFKDPHEYCSLTDASNLIANSNYWLDWKIQEIIEGKQLTNAINYDLCYRKYRSLLKAINNNNSLYEFCLDKVVENLFSAIGSGKSLPQRKRILEGLYNETSFNKVRSKKSDLQKIQIVESDFLFEAERVLFWLFLQNKSFRKIIVESITRWNVEFENEAEKIYDLVFFAYEQNPIFEIRDIFHLEPYLSLGKNLQSVVLKLTMESNNMVLKDFCSLVFLEDEEAFFKTDKIVWQIHLLLIQISLYYKSHQKNTLINSWMLNDFEQQTQEDEKIIQQQIDDLNMEINDLNIQGQDLALLLQS